jgi:hypothetical protein
MDDTSGDPELHMDAADTGGPFRGHQILQRDATGPRCAARLAASIAGMDDTLVSLLSRIPAPSLQFLTGRMEDPGLLDLLRPHLQGDDLDLLARYTPQMWRLLLDGLRQPEHLGVLGLGWAQVVAQDRTGVVDARVLLQIAANAGRTGPAVVRALLGTAPGDWPLVCAHPALAASWLAEQGDLEIAGVVAGFPDTGTALARYGTDGLRNALELGLNLCVTSVPRGNTGTGPRFRPCSSSVVTRAYGGTAGPVPAQELGFGSEMTYWRRLAEWPEAAG